MNDPIPQKSNLWMAAVVFTSNVVFLFLSGVISFWLVSRVQNITPVLPLLISYGALVFSVWIAVGFIERRSKVSETNIFPVAFLAILPVLISQAFIIGAALDQMLSAAISADDLKINLINMIIAFFVRDSVTILSVAMFMRNAVKRLKA